MASGILVRAQVFVTGGSGFIGRHVVAALAKASDRPLRCLTRAGVLPAGPANIAAPGSSFTSRREPIVVRDGAAYLVSMLDESALPNRAVDLGGPDVVSMEELLRRIHRARRGREAPVVHVPVRRAIQFLAWMERWVGGVLPVTAGKLAAFVNDSTARPDPSVADRVPRMTSLDAMLKRLVAHG